MKSQPGENIFNFNPEKPGFDMKKYMNNKRMKIQKYNSENWQKNVVI